MLELFFIYAPIAILAGAFLVLMALSYIDLKIGLLPNVLVLTFAILGFAYHGIAFFAGLSIIQMALGILMGGGLLYTVRFVANWHYKTDTLGLGDVKLLAAAGIWLGPELVLIALTLGAFAGFLHGCGVWAYTALIRKEHVALGKLSIPAGPGFIVGILIAWALQYSDFWRELYP